MSVGSVFKNIGKVVIKVAKKTGEYAVEHPDEVIGAAEGVYKLSEKRSSKKAEKEFYNNLERENADLKTTVLKLTEKVEELEEKNETLLCEEQEIKAEISYLAEEFSEYKRKTKLLFLILAGCSLAGIIAAMLIAIF